ncbi:MAG: DinB family protein [Acidobacteria bacterium]|nr:DinB family protein [Acidobacteriota bacterium]
MAISDMLLQEFDQEMAGARKTLERVPDDRLEWSPHAKSGTMGWLAGHLANVPSWTVLTIGRDSLDLAPGGKPMDPAPQPGSSAELVATLDRHAAEARAAIAGASDEELMQPWSLLQNGQVMMTLPRLAVLRSFVFNHLIHHRAQLGVYLRLNDIPVPSIYGPSADENPSGS